MLAQDNTGTRTLKRVSDHALNSTVRSNSFGCLVISPLCAQAARRCGTELNRCERDAWLLGARLHHQMSGPGPDRQFAAVQRCVSFWRRTRRLAAAVNTAAHDPKEAFGSQLSKQDLLQ
jgi:hypothetical protein